MTDLAVSECKFILDKIYAKSYRIPTSDCGGGLAGMLS